MTRHDIAVDHVVTDVDDYIHKHWDNGIEPVLTVESGDVVTFECRDASDGEITEETTPADLVESEFVGHALTELSIRQEHQATAIRHDRPLHADGRSCRADVRDDGHQ